MVSEKVSVMLVQWGKADLTLRAVDAIRRSDYDGEVEVLVYDNASPDGPGPVADRSDVTFVAGDENIGFGPAHNRLANMASGEFLLILNNDTLVDPRAVRRLVARAMRPDRPGVVSPQYRDFEGRVLEMGGYLGNSGAGWQLFRGQRPPESMQRLSYPALYGSGAALLVGREDFLRLGGFDDIFSPAYYEDTDLCLKLAAEDRPTVVEPTALVFHYEGATAGRDTDEGFKRFQVRNRTLFVKRWMDQLAKLPEISTHAALSHAFAPDPGGMRVLWVSPHIPRPDREAGHHRMSRMIKAVADAGDAVGLWAEHCIDADRYGRILEDAGVNWFGFRRDYRWGIQPEHSVLAALDELASAIPWDVIVVSFPELASRMLPLLRSARPEAAILVDDVDLHFLRVERGKAAGLNVTEVIPKEEELAVYEASDGVITASDLESEILREALPGLPVWSYTVAADEPRVDEGSTPSSLLFLGNFNHEPNADAVEWWIEELGPAVEKQVGHPIQLRVVGTGSEVRSQMWQKAAGSQIDCAGWVPDLEPELADTRVFLAPLRYGAGTKGKILNALTHGVPVVTTSIGAEGNTDEVISGLIVADEPEEIARHVAELMTDAEVWNAARHRAIDAGRAVWANQLALAGELVAWIRRRAQAGPGRHRADNNDGGLR